MDFYTATEQAYKNGKAEGLKLINWIRGRSVPVTVERALLQKPGGRVFYLEGKQLELAVERWHDIIAWAEVTPMPE